MKAAGGGGRRKRREWGGTAWVCEQKKGALQHPFVRIAQITVFCEYYMIQKLYVKCLTGLLQSAGKTVVSFGGHTVP